MINTPSPQEQAIRDQFPSPRYRVSRYAYPAGTAFGLTVRKAICYVIEGACKYASPSNEVLLKAGDNSVLDSGNYRFEVLGDSRLVCLHIWDLKELRQTVNDSEVSN